MRATFAILLTLVATTVNAQNTLPHQSLDSYLAVVKAAMPRSGTNGYTAPSSADATAFREAVALLLAGHVREAGLRFADRGYSLSWLHDADGSSYLVAHETEGSLLGRGTYILNARYDRNAIVEVPHPLFDTNTLEEGAKVMRGLRARMLITSGTHRCANATASSCSGTTTACSPGTSQAYRVSDMAHSLPSFFQAAHLAADEAGMTILNLHGNASEVPDVEVSDGTKETRGESALVNRFRTALKARGVIAASCNLPADNPATLNLCGTTNVQGRASNGSPNACSSAADEADGTFLHIEQHLNIRNAPGDLIDAAREVIATTTYERPVITTITPGPPGSGGIRIFVNGQGFRDGALVSSGQTWIPTSFVSAAQLMVILPNDIFGVAGALALVVTNPDLTASEPITYTLGAVGPRRRSARP